MGVRLSIRLVLVIATVFASLVAPRKANGQDESTIIVSFKGDAIPELQKTLSQGYEAEVLFRDLNIWKITIPDNLKSSTKKALTQHKDFRYLHDDLFAPNRRLPNDPDYVSQWSFDHIGMRAFN